MNTPLDETQIFAPKIDAAWAALQRQYGSRITPVEIDHLFACFVHGLTSPMYAEREPALHFETCRTLVMMKLPPDRAIAALCSVPAQTQPWVESACQLIESKAVRIGILLQEDCGRREEANGADASNTERLRNEETVP